MDLSNGTEIFSNVSAVIIPSVNTPRQEEGKKEEKLKI